MSTLREIREKIERFRSKVVSSLSEISDLDITSMTVIEQHLRDPKLINSISTVKIQAVIDYMYEQVNIGNWKEVRLFLRKTITITTYLRLLAHFKCIENHSNETIKEALRIIDFGILFGCPLDAEPKLLQVCATSLHSGLTIICETSGVSTRGVYNSDIELKNNSCNLNVLDVISCPTMESFFREHILAEKPVVLDNCISHWPALTKWQDQNYFIKLAGLRTVSIELGRDYTDSKWTQKLMTIEDFIKNHIYAQSSTTGYLAQYQLFDQIPELKNDITAPEYCCFSDKDDCIDIMAWYGPKGTVSPLHHDPKKNLLAQVVGEKQIFLFSPQQSEYLYPHQHELLINTARVDPRKPDLEKHPKFKEAKGFFCVLKPGQMLYIPPRWWHFVESLSVSFSVSFWWE
ncbi:bifunctional peptidase and arginyl-hydroxylase JMJD5 [Pararge aegeria]|uniref:Jg7500 protein n=2 Tax=Pararge aegeria TaxID=116150 RepID=A0A8S4RE04_9NEOP|nr:bifunctional peptidase and arginyl-hydroxylase JMJD5 [Pararge aegeria]CAH2235089.1 jg7500 [Pararge aegeria aegeria]